jgi:hypothetical protein
VVPRQELALELGDRRRVLARAGLGLALERVALGRELATWPVELLEVGLELLLDPPRLALGVELRDLAGELVDALL